MDEVDALSLGSDSAVNPKKRAWTQNADPRRKTRREAKRDAATIAYLAQEGSPHHLQVMAASATAGRLLRKTLNKVWERDIEVLREPGSWHELVDTPIPWHDLFKPALKAGHLHADEKDTTGSKPKRPWCDLKPDDAYRERVPAELPGKVDPVRRKRYLHVIAADELTDEPARTYAQRESRWGGDGTRAQRRAAGREPIGSVTALHRVQIDPLS